ncbi:MAG TPA: hypothetical protein VK498_04725 [Ferruginibacter sp.]|nr:hypothetical protein [Ferruginibacter sp.]
MDEVLKKPSGVIRLPAILISYIFHPVFIPLYAIAFLVFVHPGYFAGFSLQSKYQTLLITALNTLFFPLLSIGLLKALGFIQSVFLRTQKDRIIPYIACGIFYFWTFTVFKEQSSFDPVLSSFMLGVFLASSAALIANIYFKVSMHAIGMGGWLGLFIIISNSNSMLMTWPLSILMLITGLVCSARLFLTDHTQKDIYSGLATGLLTQWVAAMVMM